MSEYRVEWTGTVREVYYVEADSEAEAREKWSDGDPENSEVMDGAVTSVEVVEDDD